jgi:CRISPR system Cascade subunit CasA
MSADSRPPTFDLLTEPWIRCELLDGTTADFGIRDLFARAHELRTIADPSPLATIGIYRLLLAIMDRALAPTTRAEWVAVWEQRRLPEATLRTYLDRWSERFDLFHPERPFLQVAKLEAAMQARTGRQPERMQVWRMIMETSLHSAGTTHLFERMPQDPWVRPRDAARGLLGFLLFAQGGRITNEPESWSAGPLRSGAAVLVLGDNLAKTLKLNTLIRPERDHTDLPPWEKASSATRTTRSFLGPCDRFLFQSRLVEFFPEWSNGEWVVREVVTGAGERCDDSAPEPMFAYWVRDPKKPPVAVRIAPDRSAWRDANALFDAATGAEQYRRPRAVQQAASLIEEGVLDPGAQLRLSLLGLASDQAKILLSRAEEMPAPRRLLTDPDCADALKRGLVLAEGVAHDLEYKALFVLCKRALAPGERDADKDDIRRLRESLGAMSLYWAALGGSFAKWIAEIDRNTEAALETWKQEIHRAAHASFATATQRLGVNARSLAAAAQAERTLHRLLHEHLRSPSAAHPVAEVNT